ncbi:MULTISPECIES: T9SS type A sorting domain-containing protein [unclassified Bacteroides]|jgi:hypothetical protein|uniref:T9SS type A sorting domain-containing protein n=1 Tax=unclassified Bacteroides TaxID=2646097 RepID=UPI000E8C246A|nr:MULTISPECIES: T9SS type A sorting domain-containing protein [unclassified Bacteroides]RGN50912.1 T9SS C-terminal target domain-containing protein [Bacteroides sp. OM05-12]RHR82199.1 T9SS C-terminal target domain-containing protein [Bacteroides sp. AF16-49]
MKRIALLFSVCLAVSVWAGNGNTVNPFGNNLKSEPLKLKMKIQQPAERVGINRQERSAADVKAKMVSESQQTLKEGLQLGSWLDEAGLRALAKESTKQRLDSIVAVVNSTNENFSRQCFTYDERNLPKLRTNYVWDYATKKWISAEEYGYEWDEDSYCLSQWGINTMYNDGGQKYEFTYNDRKLGISQVISNYVSGKWIPSEKGIYTYDDRGNIIEEMLYRYDEDNSEWVYANHNKVSYDAKGRQTSWEGYTWDGTDWTPTGEKQEYGYDDNGNQLYWSFSIWQPETKTWLNHHRVEQTFENNLITVQEEKFWNKTLQSWVGVEEYNGAVLYNGKTDFRYDDQNREIYEVAYTAKTLEGYKKAVDMEFVYTPLDNGGTKLFRKTYFYTDDTNKELKGELTKEFDANGQITYAFERQDNPDVGAWVNCYEEKYEYNEAGNLKGSRYWIYEYTVENKKLAEVSEEYIYDNNQNIVDSYYQTGQGTSEDDWVNVSRFTYKFEQDTVRVEKLAYRWDGEAFIPNWGDGCSFDYTVPAENIIMWIGDRPYHKITETRSYVADGTEWDYWKFVYHYSDAGTGLEKNTVDGSVSVYPNPVADVLYIRAEGDVEVAVYSVEGARLLMTQEKQVNMSSFHPGVYIVDVNGVRTKVAVVGN